MNNMDIYERLKEIVLESNIDPDENYEFILKLNYDLASELVTLRQWQNWSEYADSVTLENNELGRLKKFRVVNNRGADSIIIKGDKKEIDITNLIKIRNK